MGFEWASCAPALALPARRPRLGLSINALRRARLPPIAEQFQSIASVLGGHPTIDRTTGAWIAATSSASLFGPRSLMHPHGSTEPRSGRWGRRFKSCHSTYRETCCHRVRHSIVGRIANDRPAGPVLGCHLRAYDDERTGERAPRAGDGSLVDNRHRTSARTTVCADKHFVLVALRSACGGLAVGTSNADGAVSCKWRHSAGRPRGTFRALRAGRSQWTSRPRRTGLTFFTSRAYRAGISLGGRACPVHSLPRK